jgi:hypothetical protein
MKIRVAIPEGKKISFADNIDLWHAVVKGNSNFDDTYFANTTWTVENGKVKCIAGENHFNAEKDEVLTEDESAVVDEHGKKLKKQIKILKEKDKEQEDRSDDEDKDKDF